MRIARFAKVKFNQFFFIDKTSLPGSYLMLLRVPFSGPTLGSWVPGPALRSWFPLFRYAKLQVCNFIKQETLAQVFSCEFCEISRNIFFKEHLQETAFLSREENKA